MNHDDLIFAEWDGLDAEQRAALDDRCAADPTLRDARQRARQLRSDLRELGPRGTQFEAPPLDIESLARVTPLPRRRPVRWVAAAAVMLMGIGGWWALSVTDDDGPAAPLASEGPTPPAVTAPAESAAEPAPAAAPEAIAVGFRLRAPAAQAVTVAGDFNDWQPETLAMRRTEDGVWTASTALPPGRYAYMYVVDGQWMTPPDARRTQDDGFGARNGVLDLLEPSDA